MDRSSNGTNGSSGFSISLGPKKGPPRSTTAPRKPLGGHSAFSKPANKRGPALSDDEDDHDGDDHRDKVQLVTGFGSRGAITADGEKEAKTLVIPALKNKDWRAESRKKKGIYLPPEAIAQREGASVDTRDIIGDEPMKVGLQFVEKSTAGMSIAEGDVGMPDVENGASEEDAQAEKVKKTEDQLAMEALLAGDKAKASTLTIPAASGNVQDSRTLLQNEDDAYRADVASRPDAATLEEYAAVPVEEFGAALLRGMGWKEGQSLGKTGGAANKPRLVEKRPAFLGIGAKGIGAEEIGAWGKGDKKGRQRVDKTYLPITLVDKDGKRVEEDGKKDLVKKDVDKDWKRRDDRDRSDKRDRDRDYYDDRDSSRFKRDRDRDRDDTRDRDRRDRDKDRDRGSYRERSRDRKDRDRTRDKDNDKNYDRKHGSSSYDGRDRDRDRRRHRSRSRERHRR
ncbi:hypothetical protein H072_9302 [Dactylellina haptotyla CBS 200.50]|uniref:Pre-mRNA-splicing factor n=1 Tax=Dactylellina haptotyla (strain CBS 200.50) TaxID=1284197 RepID=S8A240_DACHA|nr:hypothetical protein H072_9302 [Dactylellina haptotyla CBS 200.50]